MSDEIRSHRDLHAWQKAMDLVVEVYETSGAFPEQEIYGLTSQVRRAAVSVPSNIAEGYRRCSRLEYLRFLRIAFGSCGELETQLDLCLDMGFLSQSDHTQLSALQSDVSKMLNGLIRSIGKWGEGGRG